MLAYIKKKMIDIKERIVQSYQETRYLKLLYDDRKWYQYPQTIYFTIFILLSILFFFLEPTYQIIFLIVWGTLLLLGFFAFINPWNKKRLKSKLNIESKNDKLTHWASIEFRESQLENFSKKLLENKVLKGKSGDIQLINSYEKLFINEANLSKSREKLVLGGGVILLFILPIWNTLTSLLLAEKQNMIENIKIIFQFIFIIFCLIYSLNLMKYWIEEFLNKTYWKYIDIGRNLHQIKLNLELNNVS